ncbi:MAG TPA: heavy metal-binding domain-containing protein [Polyangiales bacterium]|nr:heavy metal-binding domain-containing protein [Polyangiales bacterium]
MNRVARMVCVYAAWLIAACAQSGERASARAPGSSEAEEAPARAIATSLASDPLGEQPSAPAQHAHDEDATIYTCPMHPEVQQAGPGECPKCGMKLVPKSPSSTEAKPAHEHAN